MNEIEKTHPTVKPIWKFEDGVFIHERTAIEYTIDKSIVERDYISKAELREIVDSWIVDYEHYSLSGMAKISLLKRLKLTENDSVVKETKDDG